MPQLKNEIINFDAKVDRTEVQTLKFDGEMLESIFNVYVIADEIHGDITYQHNYTPLASISNESSQNCATCISPIKSFNLAGVANSMIVIDDEEKRSLCKSWFSRFEINKNNVFTNAAMLSAYTNGQPWLDQVIEYLD